MKPRPIDHELAHHMADLACDAGDYWTAVELLERAELGGNTGILSSLRTNNRLRNLRLKLPLTHGEQQILDACMVGATQSQIANNTGWATSVARRTVRKMQRRGHLRRTEVREHDGGRLQTTYTREDPED